MDELKAIVESNMKTLDSGISKDLVLIRQYDPARAALLEQEMGIQTNLDLNTKILEEAKLKAEAEKIEIKKFIVE